MKKQFISIVAILLVAALTLSACDAVEEYSQRRADHDSLIPGTGGTASDNRNDNWNDNANDNWNDNRNDNWNDNANDNWNDNHNDNWNDNHNDNLNANDNWNDNANDNGRGVPVTGEQDLDRDNLYRVDDLIGYPLETAAGERMGRIDSLLIHPISGKIHFVVVEAERDLEHDRDYVLVPWNALHTWAADPYEGVPPGQLPPPDQREPMNCSDLPPGHLPPPHMREELCLDYDEARDGRALVFGFDRDTMRRGPSFTNDDLLERDGGRWEDDAVAYWRGHLDDIPRLDDEGRRRGYLRIADDNTSLINRDGDRIGDITNLLVHVPSGQIQHAVVQGGGLFQRSFTLVPYNQLDWSPPNDAFVLTINRNQFDRLPTYDREEDLPVRQGLGRRD
jgi:sporulation protein YlmC with PRC-barrel domain